MPERRIEGTITEGASGSQEPAFLFFIELEGLDPDQTARIRDQAAEALARNGSSERAIVIGAFRAIHKAATERLADQVKAPNWLVVTVAPDPTDPLSHIRDDRGRIFAIALANADDPDEAIAAFWRKVADGFDYLYMLVPYRHP